MRKPANFPVNLVIWIYSIIFTICLPFLFLRLWYRSRKNPEYRHHWLQRLGIFQVPPSLNKHGLWIHAVSVGESIAAVPLIQAFQQQFPHLSVTVTTTTPTGKAEIKRRFGDTVFHVYFPYDLPLAFATFLKKIQPKLCVLMETELWINALRSMKQYQIPCIVVNGRLSQKSMQGYKKIAMITRDMFHNIQHVVAQSEEDGRRFVDLGLDKNRLTIGGNVKFDCKLLEVVEDELSGLQIQWGRERPVIVAASTHAGEEIEILGAYSELKKEFKDLLLILVPRHPDRFNSVANEIKKRNFNFVRRSQATVCDPRTEIFLGDSMGELALFYQAAHIAFVGGSLVPVGGHNTLEPASVGLPIIVGPYTYNFNEITKLMLEAGGLKQVPDKNALLFCLQKWLREPDIAKHIGACGKKVVLENKGAVDKIFTHIKSYFL